MQRLEPEHGDLAICRPVAVVSESGKRSSRRWLSWPSRRFWDERLALDGVIVEQAIERGEVPPDTQRRQVIESVLARSISGCCSPASPSTVLSSRELSMLSLTASRAATDRIDLSTVRGATTTHTCIASPERRPPARLRHIHA